MDYLKKMIIQSRDPQKSHARLGLKHPRVAENIAPVGGPGSHWPHPQLTTADWWHLCHTSITLITICLCPSVKRTILHSAIVSRGNPLNNDITSWAPHGCNNFCYPRVVYVSVISKTATMFTVQLKQWRIYRAVPPVCTPLSFSKNDFFLGGWGSYYTR